jgi:hypothetical protein
MKTTKLVVFAGILLLGIETYAQEFPRFEIGADYSYARYAPSAPYSQGHSLNGGGGSAAFNLNDALGFKMDLQGYGSNTTSINIAPGNPLFPNGLTGKVQGNLFTYQFGPQITVRAHMVQPYVHALFGGAHSNVYSNLFKQLCVSHNGACPGVTKQPVNNSFSMSLGGGVDIPLGKHIAFRPAEIDYLLTSFDNPFTGGSHQHNFRYSAGVVFAFGHSIYR